MFRKVTLVLLVLFGFVLSGMAGECFADVSAELKQAQGYFENSDYQRAEQIYQGIIKQCSDANQALEAQKGLVMVYISLGKQAEAETAYQQLLLNFPHNTHMADVIHHGIASHYRKCKKDDKADEIDKYVLSHWPTTESAMWAQVDLVRSSINGKNDAAAQTGVDNLLASFANNEHLCDAIHSVAYRYRQSVKTAKADELDQYVLNHWPSTESAMWAQVDIVRSSIDGKNYTAAQAGVDNLLARFSSNENMANVLHGMAYKYRQSQENARADELDQYVLDHWPSSEIALWARVDIVKSSIDGNDAAADAAFDKLLAAFSQQPTLLKEIYQVASAYDGAGRYDKAGQLYQYVIDNQPKTEHAIWAKASTTKLNILLGNEAAVEAALNNLIADFNNHPDLLAVVLGIAEPYWNKALRLEGEGLQGQAKDYFKKALRIAEIAKDKCPNYVESADTLYWTGVCYRALGNYEKTIECFQKVVDNWPDFRHAGEGLFLVGVSYENLKEQGLVSTSEADLKLKVTYEHLLQKYPTCAGAEHARHWLSRYNSKLEEK